MSAMQFANDAQTTLAGAIGSGAVSLAVASATGLGWKDDNDETPRLINEALDRGDFEEARRLFERSPEFLYAEDGTDIWLWMAAASGDLARVIFLVQVGIDVNSSSDKNMVRTAIESAAGEGRLEVVRWLLDHGAVINHPYGQIQHSSSLVYAALGGHLDVIRLLLDRGADIHGVASGMNALMHAEACGHQEVAAYLRSVGAKDLRETTPPDRPRAHKLIHDRMVQQFGPASDWRADLPGDPAVVVRRVPVSRANLAEQLLFTVGLSDRRLPSGNQEYACGELRLTLPVDWPDPDTAEKDPQWAWPIQWLKRIVNELRSGDRWPADPVLFPNGNPPQPFHSSTEMCCWMVLVVQGGSVQCPDHRWIDFHGLIPIYADEMKLVQEQGHEALVLRLQARNLPHHLDPQRPNVSADPDPNEYSDSDDDSDSDEDFGSEDPVSDE